MPSPNMRLLFISPKYPVNSTEARGRVIENYLRQLKEKYEVQISLVCIGDDIPANVEKPFYLDQLTVLRQPWLGSQLFNILVFSCVMGKAPLQCYLYWSKRLNRQVDAVAQEFKPDIVVCELIRTALYNPTGNAKQVCDLADLFSIRYKQQSAKAKSIERIMGQYSSGPWSIFLGLIGKIGLKRYVLKLETRLVEKMERRLPEKFDCITLVSPREVDELRKTTGSAKVKWVPNGTNPPLHKIPKLPNRKPIILFLGVMNVPHNEEAVLHFSSTILPRIRQAVPDCEFHIAGKNPTTRVERLSECDDSIKVTGFITDIEQLVAAAKVFVAPMLSGSGVQTKLFEAMKYGIPIVATPLTARGIVESDRNGVIVCQNDEDIASACVRILAASNTEWRKIGAPGCTTVARNYYWDAVGRRLYQVLKETMQKC